MSSVHMFHTSPPPPFPPSLTAKDVHKHSHTRDLQCSSVHMFHTPRLRGLTKRMLPARFNEIVGVQHVKLYLFDDTLVLSGCVRACVFACARVCVCKCAHVCVCV